jgi:hypothetical protein
MHPIVMWATPPRFSNPAILLRGEKSPPALFLITLTGDDKAQHGKTLPVLRTLSGRAY